MNSYEMITMAEKLIQYLQPAMTSQDIQLSMTNLKGSIIASTRKDNVGKFCEPALRSVTRKQTVEVSSETRSAFFLGQEGSYLPVFHGRNVLGVLALEGVLSRTKPLEEMCRLTAEAFLKWNFIRRPIGVNWTSAIFSPKYCSTVRKIRFPQRWIISRRNLTPTPP